MLPFSFFNIILLFNVARKRTTIIFVLNLKGDPLRMCNDENRDNLNSDTSCIGPNENMDDTQSQNVKEFSKNVPFRGGSLPAQYRSGKF